MFVMMAISLVAILSLACSPGLGRRVPINYILLLVYTLSMGFMISMSCGLAGATIDCSYPNCLGYGNTYLVVTAAGITVGLVLGLTVYAFIAKTDFTFWGGFLWMALFSLAFMGMFMGIFGANSYYINGYSYMNTWYIFYCTIGVIIFGMYLIYDTQLIAGGKRLELSIDDYILGALLLYVDIMRIFLYILSIL